MRSALLCAEDWRYARRVWNPHSPAPTMFWSFSGSCLLYQSSLKRSNGKIVRGPRSWSRSWFPWAFLHRGSISALLIRECAGSKEQPRLAWHSVLWHEASSHSCVITIYNLVFTTNRPDKSAQDPISQHVCLNHSQLAPRLSNSESPRLFIYSR